MFHVSRKTELILLGLATIIVVAIGSLTYHFRSLFTSPALSCSSIDKDSAKFTCYGNYFASIVHTLDPAYALKELISIQSSDLFAAKTCHELTHIIGEEAYAKYGSVTKASTFGSNFCYSGYYHGVMENYMSKFDDAKLAALMPTICKMDPSGRYTQGYYDCVHGLGHGVTIRFDNDVFKALPYCDLLKTDFDRNACYNGAFMQNILVDGISHKAVDVKPDDPVYPCDAVPERQKDACYLIQTSYILQIVQGDVARAFAVCDGVEAPYVKTCYQSMGRDISGIADGIPAKVVALCGLGSPDNQGECFAGAAGDAVYRNGQPSDADPLCAATPKQYQSFCQEGKKAAAALQNGV